MEIGESTKLLVPNIRETVENEELGVLLDFFQQQHPSDSAELFEELEIEAVAEIVRRLQYPRTVLNQVFD